MIRKQTFVTTAVTSLIFASAAFAQGGPAAQHKGLGVGMQGDDQGVHVVSMMPGSPAEKAGVKVGDQVVSIAGVPILEFDPDKMRIVADTAKTVAFVVMRDGQQKTFQIEPAVMTVPALPPASITAPPSGAGQRAPR